MNRTLALITAAAILATCQPPRGPHAAATRPRPAAARSAASTPAPAPRVILRTEIPAPSGPLKLDDATIPANTQPL